MIKARVRRDKMVQLAADYKRAKVANLAVSPLMAVYLRPIHGKKSRSMRNLEGTFHKPSCYCPGCRYYWGQAEDREKDARTAAAEDEAAHGRAVNAVGQCKYTRLLEVLKEHEKDLAEEEQYRQEAHMRARRAEELERRGLPAVDPEAVQENEAAGDGDDDDDHSVVG